MCAQSDVRDNHLDHRDLGSSRLVADRIFNHDVKVVGRAFNQTGVRLESDVSRIGADRRSFASGEGCQSVRRRAARLILQGRLAIGVVGRFRPVQRDPCGGDPRISKRTGRADSRRRGVRQRRARGRCVQRLVPGGASTVSALVMGFAWGLGALLTPITGKLSEPLGLTNALLIVALWPLASAVLFWRFPKDKVMARQTVEATPREAFASGD